MAAVAGSANGQFRQEAAESTPVRVTAGFAGIPMSFEPNRGQAAAGVDALARGAGYTLLLGRGDATLMLAGAAEPGKHPAPSSVLAFKLKGSQPLARVTEEGELTARSNYFLGNDPAKWRTDIPEYARVRYAGVYPGIDLVYYGNGHALEHDFVVAPGANPAQIRFRIGGADRVLLDPRSGDLLLTTGTGTLRLHKPVTYQTIAGKRTEVASRYALAKGGEVEFRLGKYDSSEPLVIDPEISYSTLVPPISSLPLAVAVDAKGFSYLTGSTGSDVVVYKLSPGGSELVYTSIFGGSSFDGGSAIAVDNYGDAYVTGATSSSDFPTLNAFQSTPASDFVAKLNAAGDALLYSTYLGGSGHDGAYGIAVDAAQRAYVIGSTTSTDFPTHLPIQAALKGSLNLFITAFNESGSTLLYSTYLGGSGSDYPSGIALDPLGDVYVAGTTTSTDFPVKNPFQPKNNNNNQGFFSTTGFLAKIYPTGPQLLYSTYLGGSLGETVRGVAADASGNAYVAGQTASPDFPIANAYQSTGGSLLGQPAPCPAGGYSTAFVTKFNPKGSALVYSTYLGQVEPDDNAPGAVDYCAAELPVQNGATGIAVDSSGDAVVTGYTYSTHFPTTDHSGNSGAQGNCSTSAFITRFNPSGSALLYSGYFGGLADSGDDADICTGSGGTTASGVAVDSVGNAYIFGSPIAFLEFPLSSAAYENTPYGHYSWDYEAKYAFTPMAQTVTTLTAPYASINGSNTAILTAKVAPAVAGGAIPTGSVGFFVNQSQAGVATLNAQGIATLEYTFPTQNQYTIQANYSGNIDTDASTVSLTKGFGITNVPGFSPAAGTYHYEPTITLADRLTGAVIHYTLNGTTPNESSPVYTAPIVLTQSTTINAFAITPTTAPSAVVTAAYVIDTPAATPVFSVAAGTYTTAQTVTIADATAGATIYYTVNGATPTTASTKYTGAIKVSSTETIKAIAVATGHETSATASAAYTIK
jgi:hypothetical protein